MAGEKKFACGGGHNALAWPRLNPALNQPRLAAPLHMFKLLMRAKPHKPRCVALWPSSKGCSTRPYLLTAPPIASGVVTCFAAIQMIFAHKIRCGSALGSHDLEYIEKHKTSHTRLVLQLNTYTQSFGGLQL